MNLPSSCCVLVSQTKQWNEYANCDNTIHVFIGKDQRSNQALVNKFADSTRCFWFHLDESSSAHVVLTYDATVTTEKLIQAFKWVRKELKKKKIDDEVIFCRMQDVRSTKTIGEMTFVNEVRMNTDWTQDLLKQM